MNYKVVKKIGDRLIAKYYGSEDVAKKKSQYKGWTLQKHVGDLEYSARSINKGKTESPKYEISIEDIDVKFGCPTEGIANQIVELLSVNYKDVRCKFVGSASSTEVLEDDGEI